MILGLDVSTSCTGWCILNEDGNFIEMGFIPLGKLKTTYVKAEEFRAKLTDIHIKFNVSKVYIEENLQAFRPGFSSAKTLLTLSRFNGIVSYLCAQQFQFEPEHINVNIARKCLGLKIIKKSKGGKPTKEQVVDWVSNELNGSFSWPTKILKSGPRKGLKIHIPECYDMADAYVIARAGTNLF